MRRQDIAGRLNLTLTVRLEKAPAFRVFRIVHEFADLPADAAANPQLDPVPAEEMRTSLYRFTPKVTTRRSLKNNSCGEAL